MSHYPESSSKRFMPVLLGASILGGGLMSVAVAIRAHEQPTAQSLTEKPSTQIAAAPSAQSGSPTAIATSAPRSEQPATRSSGASASGASTAQANPQTTETLRPSDLPRIGTIKEMVAGDLMCYLTVQENSGATRQVGATFEVCEQTNFLNQRVRFSYEPATVNDCQSAEPCGKSRSVLLVSRLELVEGNSTDRATPSSPTQPSPDKYTITNGEWTITVSNIRSWSGVNNTGNLSYEGCNSQNECLRLQGGQVSCRDGICTMGWQNGDHTYILESPMEGEDAARQTEATTLIVRQGDTVILRANGFRPVEN